MAVCVIIPSAVPIPCAVHSGAGHTQRSSPDAGIVGRASIVHRGASWGIGACIVGHRGVHQAGIGHEKQLSKS